MHTSTFQGNPLACSMAVATIETIRGQNLLTHVQEVVEPRLRERLGELADHDLIHAVRISGAQAAIEFIASNGGSGSELVVDIQRQCLENNILVYGGGRQGNVLILLPPIMIDSATLERGLERVRAIIETNLKN